MQSSGYLLRDGTKWVLIVVVVALLGAFVAGILGYSKLKGKASASLPPAEIVRVAKKPVSWNGS